MQILTGLTLLHSLFFLVYWLTNALFYASVNEFLGKAVKLQVDFVLIFMLLSAAIGLWSLVRLILVWGGRKVGGKVFFITISAIYLIFFYGSFAVLFMQDPVQVRRLGQLIGYFRIFLDALLLLGAAWLLRPFVRKSRMAWLAPVVILVLIWSGAALAPPGSVVQGNLPEKPKVTAHRGASMLAPENTLAAFEKASVLGAQTLETDIRISLDGVPFLMHDTTLARTTNVASVFPGREKERAETFTFSEIKRLNAGSWFTSKDPFGSIRAGQVSAQEVAIYAVEPVPSLAEMLKVVKQTGRNFIFDLYPPPADHPFAASFFDLCLKQIKEAGIDAQVWFLVNDTEMVKVKAAAPQMVLTAGVGSDQPPTADTLTKKGYQIVNSEYGLPESAIRDYTAAGLRVNLWTVDEPWQFSRLWLLGVNSITTNNTHTMAALKWPVLALTKPAYLAVWSGIGLLSLLILLLRNKPTIENG